MDDNDGMIRQAIALSLQEGKFKFIPKLEGETVDQQYIEQLLSNMNVNQPVYLFLYS